MGKSKRFRIKPEIASALGLELNKSNRYRLTPEQEQKFLKIKDPDAFEDILHSNNFTPDDNWEYGWVKSKEGSIFVRNPNKKGEISFDELRDKLVSELNQYSPKFKEIGRELVDNPHCLVIDIADLHIGKYASVYGTGESYDSATAFNVAMQGLHGILAKSSGFNLDKIVFVIGNDILHTDNTIGSTTKGTNQDTDLIWYENFLIAKELYVKCVETLLPLADIHIVYCPSNHDYMSGFMLADTIHSYFRNSENITFDLDMRHRKYYQYGANLLGFTHGDGAKMEQLPLLMANEDKVGWAETVYRYVYLHHIHHKEQWKFKSGKDYQGVTTEYLRSPSASDGWHASRGFQHAKKAIEGFIHCKNNGQVCRITHHV